VAAYIQSLKESGRKQPRNSGEIQGRKQPKRAGEYKGESGKQRMKKELKHRKKIYIAAAVLILLLVTCGIYLGNYYSADDSCNQILAEAMVEDGMYAFGDTEAENGIVFYPGGKVEYTAYTNLAKDLADVGIFCVVVKVPCKLAFFDINAADDAMSRYPDIKKLVCRRSFPWRRGSKYLCFQ